MGGYVIFFWAKSIDADYLTGEVTWNPERRFAPDKASKDAIVAKLEAHDGVRGVMVREADHVASSMIWG